jgi:hypothetical protein
MTPQQRSRAVELIAVFGEAKHQARAARSMASQPTYRGSRDGVPKTLSQQVAEAEQKERRLNEVLAQMDALAEELWRG